MRTECSGAVGVRRSSGEGEECGRRSNMERSAVRDVAKYFPTAIISGRSRDKVSNLYSNCIRTTDKQGKEVNLFQPASEFLPMIDEVFSSLVEISNGIEGATVENNKFCVSIHYRHVDEKNWTSVAQSVHDVLKGYPRLRLTHGRKVLEVRPVIDWDVAVSSAEKFAVGVKG